MKRPPRTEPTMSKATIEVHGKTITNDEVWICRVYYPTYVVKTLAGPPVNITRPAYTRVELLRAKVTEAYTYSDGEHDPATIEWQCFGSEINVNDWPDKTSERVQPLYKVETTIRPEDEWSYPMPETWEF